MKLNKTHMHPSFILEGVISSAGALIILVFAILIGELQDNNFLIIISNLFTGKMFLFLILIAIIFFGVITFIYYIIWKRTYIYINDNFNFESGKLFKKKIKINLNDIATIIVKKNLIERILHTSQIKLELNSEGDDSINQKLVLKDSDVQKIKKIIMDKEISNDNIKSLVNYSGKDIVSHLFLSSNLFSLIIGFIVAIISFIYTIKNIQSSGTIIITIIIFAIVISVIWDFIKKYFDYHNFKLWTEDEKIKVSYGLFVNYCYEIPKTKINAITVTQSFQARILGKAVIKVINAGIGKEENKKDIICLYSDIDKINEIIQTLLPTFVNKGRFIKQKDKALITYLINKVPFMFVIAIICMWFPKWILLINLIFVIWAIIQYKTKKICIGENLITFKSGFLQKNVTTLKYSKITKIEFIDTLIGKLYNLKFIKLFTVGKDNIETFECGYFSSKIERKIINNFK